MGVDWQFSKVEYTMIEKWLPVIKRDAFVMWVVINAYHNRKTGRTMPHGVNRLSELANMSRPTARNAIRKLEKEGLIERVLQRQSKVGRPEKYYKPVLPVPAKRRQE